LKMYDGSIRTISEVWHVKGLKKKILSMGQFDNLARDRLINLRNVGTDETSSIPLAIQTRIANQYRLKCRYIWNLIDTISYPNPDSSSMSPKMLIRIKPHWYH
jgi:hypothetical protein